MDKILIFWSLLAVIGLIWSLTFYGYICYTVGIRVGLNNKGNTEMPINPFPTKKGNLKDMNLDPVVPSLRDD